MTEMNESKLHIMLDIETMGNRPHAPLCSVGAVSFDIDGVYDSFYLPVSLASSVKSGAVIDPDTVIWWMKQSKDAQSMFDDNKDSEEQSLSVVLEKFSQWYKSQRGGPVWGKGSDFDNVIVKEHYIRAGLKLPWGYRDNRCYRTLCNLYSDVEYKQYGVLHNAIDDAKSQAFHLIEIAKTHNFELK